MLYDISAFDLITYFYFGYLVELKEIDKKWLGLGFYFSN